MNDRKNMALLLEAIHKLNTAGSWTGRTHIQKYLFLASQWVGLATGHEFVLYQRGPYSFELDQAVRSIRSLGLTDIELMPAPYGPRYRLTPVGEDVRTKWYETPAQTDANFAKLAEELSSKDARDLELLATAEWVLSEELESLDDQINRLRELKPHFDESEARRALLEAGRLRSEFSAS